MKSTAELSSSTFDDACAAVVSALKQSVPLGFWSVSRHEGDRQVYVCVQDDAYGTVAGDSRPWADSLCQFMVTGATPPIVPDISVVPEYATARVAREIPVAAYAGASIRSGDGSVYGSICGLDPLVQAPDLVAQAPLLRVLAGLLEQALGADLLRNQAREREVELRRRAVLDRVTGLPNRTLFAERIDQAVRRRRRAPAALAVLLADLDAFGAVNDAYGYAVGDRLLADVAARVDDVLGPADTLARVGDDQFGVLLADGADGLAAAARVLAVLKDPFAVDGTQIQLRASVGLAELGVAAAAVDVDGLWSQADVAMSAAKRAGGSRIARFETVATPPEAHDLRLREPLRRALEAGALRLHYQPIVELGTAPVRQFEALARWDLDGVDVPPEVFVPVAARAGLLPDLTRLVLEQACAQLARWAGEPQPHLVTVGVNVAPDALADPSFPDLVADCLTRYGLQPRQLVLEITEDAVLTDLGTASLVTRRLREIGTPLSLDDVGTGYSTLQRLRYIPLDSFKIDRSFTRDVDTDAVTQRFVRALLLLGRDLGLDVVVEGVERVSQAQALRRLGCRYAQGWCFARPVPAADVQWFTGSGTGRHVVGPRRESGARLPMTSMGSQEGCPDPGRILGRPS